MGESKRKRIAIPLQGGLGNQLFQLAAGTAVYARTGRPVCYSTYWLSSPASGETPRQFALRHLVAEDELVDTYTPRHDTLLGHLLGLRAVERSAEDDALARVGPRTQVLAGYFQRLAYVQEAWPDLRRRLATSPDSRHRRLVNTAPDDYGAIHYRLGDYVTNPRASTEHGVTSPDYFVKVIRDRLRSQGITRWMVVSDDRVRALELLRSEGPPSDVVLESPSTEDEWADLATLASARVCAISNSSFSWWAAFIGSSARDMPVVAPRPWFSDPVQAEPPLFPGSWERRDRSVVLPAKYTAKST